VKSDEEGLSFPDFPLKFEDRRRIKEIEDTAANMLLIFDSLLSTLQEMKELCEMHCKCEPRKECTCSYLSKEFDMHITQMQSYRKKIVAVSMEAQGTYRLVS
jgi:hypothetical protein